MNIVPNALVAGMNVCAVPFPAGVDELAEAGLTARPNEKAPCPWIGEAPAAFECCHHTTLGIDNSREIILDEVVYAHFRADAVNERRHVDPATLDAVDRIGGQGDATTHDYFDLPTLSVDDGKAARAARMRATCRRMIAKKRCRVPCGMLTGRQRPSAEGPAAHPLRSTHHSARNRTV